MNDIAAHLVDRVLPDVRIRQWVLSLPMPVRLLCAFRPKVLSAVLREHTRAVFAFQRHRARKLGLRDPRCGAVTVIQRFGSAMDLNVHFHTLVLDGVYTDGPVFHQIPPPTGAELQRVTEVIARKVTKALARLGLAGDDAVSTVAEAEPEVASLVAESVAFPDDRLIDPGLARLSARARGRHGQYDLHAATTVGAHDTPARERLCQYLLRPPLSDDRLTLQPDGRVALALKTPWRDGTIAILLTAIQLVARLAALVSRPGQNMIRYHGLLAANAKDRAAVVPGKTPPRVPPAHADDRQQLQAPQPMRNGRYLEWAALMLRTFSIDVLKCKCGGRLKLVAMVQDGAGAERYLRGTGLATDAQRARPPPTEVPKAEALV